MFLPTKHIKQSKHKKKDLTEQTHRHWGIPVNLVRQAGNLASSRVVYGIPSYGLPYRTLVVEGSLFVLGVRASCAQGTTYVEKATWLQGLCAKEFPDFAARPKDFFMFKAGAGSFFSVPSEFFIVTVSEEGYVGIRFSVLPPGSLSGCRSMLHLLLEGFPGLKKLPMYQKVESWYSSQP